MAIRLVPLTVICAIAGAAAIAAAPPASRTGTAPTPGMPAAKSEPRLICRGGGARQLGTHMRTRRRCRTLEQWQAEDESDDRLPVGMQVTTGQNDGRATQTPQ